MESKIASGSPEETPSTRDIFTATFAIGTTDLMFPDVDPREEFGMYWRRAAEHAVHESLFVPASIAMGKIVTQHGVEDTVIFSGVRDVLVSPDLEQWRQIVLQIAKGVPKFSRNSPVSVVFQTIEMDYLQIE